MYRALLTILLLVPLLSGGCDSASTPASTETTLTDVDTLITTQSGTVAQPVSMAVGRDGTLYILDGQTAQIHRVSTDGSILPSLGERGSGPGEFQRPTGIRVSGDTLWVTDAGNGRLQILSTNGTPLETVPLPTRVGLYYSRIISDGRILTSTLGQDSCLAIAYNTAGLELARFGIPPIDLPSGIDLGEIRAEIRSGGIPGFFRNTVLPVEIDGGQVWLGMLADGELARFSPGGEPLGVTILNEPEMAGILTEFFKRNQEETSRPSIFPLMYIADIQSTGSEVWVLLNRGDNGTGVIVTYSPDGEKIGRILLPEVTGARFFVLDPERNIVHLAIPSLAQVVSAEWAFD